MRHYYVLITRRKGPADRRKPIIQVLAEGRVASTAQAEELERWYRTMYPKATDITVTAVRS